MLSPLFSRWPRCPRRCSAWRTRCSGWATWRARSPAARRPMRASAGAATRCSPPAPRSRWWATTRGISAIRPRPADGCRARPGSSRTRSRNCAGNSWGPPRTLPRTPSKARRWRGRRPNGHSDLELMAMHAVGQALVQQGRTEEGMTLLDEAMAGVIGGEYGDPLTAAQMSCMTMVVCGSCFDLERATQWVQSLQGFIERYGCPFLYAECRTYYGRVLFENGDWGAAETLLVDAISMSPDVFQAPHAFASGTLAELRLAQGRVEDAARVLRGVEGRTEAAAAVASVRLQQGEPSAAAAVLRRRLAATSPNRLDVAGAIELLGEAEIALGDSGAAVE